MKQGVIASDEVPPLPIIEGDSLETVPPGLGDSEDDDYSASVNAILQRRASSRSKSRRKRSFKDNVTAGSSPANTAKNSTRMGSMLSVASSAETVVSLEEETPQVTEEQIFENIRLHKEVLSSVKMQPWPMRRKRRLVHQAKSYVARHEDVLQERLALSRSIRDVMARASIVIASKWRHWKREAANLGNWLVPWERRIKEIESHFGSVVASYFTFLRWLFWVNMVIAIAQIVFVVVPEILTADPRLAGERKTMLPEEAASAGDLVILWDFEGPLKYSPMFYGYYTNRESGSARSYRLPLAYLTAGLAVYIYSFVATLRKMAENSRMSKLSSKDDECIFSWKLFTGWDYMIGNAETAHNRVASIVLGFKEALLEEAERNREPRNWRVLGVRVLVNLMVVVLLGASAYAVVVVVERSSTVKPHASWWRKNEITVVMSLISIIFPIFFELLGFLERFHPRQQLRLQLARIMVLNLLNLYSLIFAQFNKIEDMTASLEQLRPNTTWNQFPEMPALSTIIPATDMVFENYDRSKLEDENSFVRSDNPSFGMKITTPNCYQVSVICNDTQHDVSGNNLPDTRAENISDSNNQSSWKSNVSLWYNFHNENVDLFNYTFYYEDYDENSFNSTDGNFSTYSTNDYQENGISKKDVSGDEQMKMCYITVCDPDDSSKNGEEDDIRYLKLESTTDLPKTTDFRRANNRPELTMETRRKLRKLCWETNFGQELVKLTVMDLIMTTLSTLMVDFLRALVVRYMNRFWCWDLEKRFPQYGDFKIAENILHLVNNQGMVWMGTFFSPGLVALNLVKLILLMYLRSWTVLTCNVPHEVVFRASRSNNFYLMLLLIMLFLCVLPVGYAIVWVEPSWHCGPFSNYKRIYHLFTEGLHNALPKSLHRSLDYIASPGTVIPLLVLLVLIIYYLISLTGSLREANQDLKLQLRRERTEERRKMFRLTRSQDSLEGAKDGTGAAGTDLQADKWRRALALRSQMAGSGVGGLQRTEDERSEFLARVMKQAFQKSFGSSEEATSPYHRIKNENVQKQETMEQNLSNEKSAEKAENGNNGLKKMPSLRKFIMGIPIHKALRMNKNESCKKENEDYTKIEESLDEVVVNVEKQSSDPEKERQVSFDSLPIITISKSENVKNLPKPDKKDKRDEEIEKSMKIIDRSVEVLKTLDASQEDLSVAENGSDGKSLVAPAEKSSVRLGRKLLKECRKWQKQNSGDHPDDNTVKTKEGKMGKGKNGKSEVNIEAVDKKSSAAESKEEGVIDLEKNSGSNESKCTEGSEGYQDETLE